MCCFRIGSFWVLKKIQGMPTKQDIGVHNTDETDVLTGEPCPSQVGDDYRLTSGNRILHSARHSEQGQQLILG